MQIQLIGGAARRVTDFRVDIVRGPDGHEERQMQGKIGETWFTVSAVEFYTGTLIPSAVTLAMPETVTSLDLPPV